MLMDRVSAVTLYTLLKRLCRSPSYKWAKPLRKERYKGHLFRGYVTASPLLFAWKIPRGMSHHSGGANLQKSNSKIYSTREFNKYSKRYGNNRARKLYAPPVWRRRENADNVGKLRIVNLVLLKNDLCNYYIWAPRICIPPTWNAPCLPGGHRSRP